MEIPSNPGDASPKIGVLHRGGRKSLGGRRIAEHPTAYLWRQSFSVANQFCLAVVNAGYLSWEQMVHASFRYHIGASKHHGVIFWQIDREGRVHDGKVMYYEPDCHRSKAKSARPTWVGFFLLKRQKALFKSLGIPLPAGSHTSHCFFGLHLLTADIFHQKATVCIVEAEKTAFILSELYPDYLWLAAGGMGEVQVDKFRQLRGRKVILFPDTDPDGIAFRRWFDAANAVMASEFWEDSPPIRVSPILELHATEEQKQRKIDLVDFIFENNDKRIQQISLRQQEHPGQAGRCLHPHLPPVPCQTASCP